MILCWITRKCSLFLIQVKSLRALYQVLKQDRLCKVFFSEINNKISKGRVNFQIIPRILRTIALGFLGFQALSLVLHEKNKVSVSETGYIPALWWQRREGAYSVGFGRKSTLSVPRPVPQNFPKFDMDDSEGMMRWLVGSMESHAPLYTTAFCLYFLICINRTSFPDVANYTAPITAAALFLWLWVLIPPGHWCLSLVSVVWCQVKVLAKCRSIAQRIPTEFCVSECDLETSTRKRSRSTRFGEPWKKKSDVAYNVKVIMNNEMGRIWYPIIRHYYMSA